MFLSIIIPTYNDEKYLAECLDSCLKQDIGYDDYEIICVDDGSVDRTPEILKEYAEKYSNISVIFKEHGVGDGRNIGLENAIGEYVWFVDHDDLIEENCLLEFKKAIYETQCDRFAFNYYRFAGTLSEYEVELKNNKGLTANGNYQDLYVWTSVIKRSFLSNNDLWPRSKRLGNRDIYFGMDSFFISECNEKIENSIKYNFEKPYYYYRMHLSQSVSDTSEKTLTAKMNSYLGFAQMYKDEYEDELQRTGQVTFKTAQNYTVGVRTCIEQLSTLPSKYRKQGFKKLKEEKLYPFNFPKIYTDTYSCWDCVKSKNGMRPLQSLAFYYVVKPIGLFFYCILDGKILKERIKGNSRYLRKLAFYKLSFKNRKK